MGLINRLFVGDRLSASQTVSHTVSWHEVASEDDVRKAIEASHNRLVLLFKHSTRCSISAMALERLQRGWDIPPDVVQPWLLDLIQHRDISNAIAERLGVVHQSPQAILLRHGRVVWHASHSAISLAALKQAMAEAA